MPEPPLKLLGLGLYTRADTARLLGLSPGRVSSWVRGYRYAWGPKERRRRGRQPAVIKTDIPMIDGSLAVSFLELVELFVVKQFRDKDIPLQTVRVAWNHAAQAFDTLHPFADRRVFTDGGSIFMALRDDDEAPDVLEVSSRRMPFQVVAGPIFHESFQEIEFDDQTALARRWWPRGRGIPIVLDPTIAFGAPVVRGTRVPTATLARYAAGRPVKAVADAFELPADQVKAALRLAPRLAAEGYPVCCDLAQLLGGEDFSTDIEEAIRQRTISSSCSCFQGSRTQESPVHWVSLKSQGRYSGPTASWTSSSRLGMRCSRS